MTTDSTTPRRPLWRDPNNPAEKTMTTYDEWEYRMEQSL